MHEMGILAQMIDIVEENCKKNNVKKIEAISVEVGELSGVLPIFLEEYWPLVIEGNQLFEDSKLNIRTIPGQALCKECNAVYNVMKFEGRCPRCKSRDKKILGGQDFMLKDITIKETIN